MHRHKTRNAAALEIFAAHGVAGTLRRDHDHVDGLLRLDQVEVDVKPVGERQRRFQIGKRRKRFFANARIGFRG